KLLVNAKPRPLTPMTATRTVSLGDELAASVRVAPREVTAEAAKSVAPAFKNNRRSCSCDISKLRLSDGLSSAQRHVAILERDVPRPLASRFNPFSLPAPGVNANQLIGPVAPPPWPAADAAAGIAT